MFSFGSDHSSNALRVTKHKRQTADTQTGLIVREEARSSPTSAKRTRCHNMHKGSSGNMADWPPQDVRAVSSQAVGSDSTEAIVKVEQRPFFERTTSCQTQATDRGHTDGISYQRGGAVFANVCKIYDAHDTFLVAESHTKRVMNAQVRRGSKMSA